MAEALRSPVKKSRICDAVACLLVLVHWTLAVTAVRTKSPTFDEPTHFAAGYSYWLRGDYRLDPEAGILPLRWATIPLLFSRPEFPSKDSQSWQSSDQGAVGRQFLYECGNDADPLLMRGRLMMALLSATLCAVIYCWSRTLFGVYGGLISLVAAAFCPTLLGHGALVTPDVTAALFFLLASWSFWRMLHLFSPGAVLLASLAVSGLLLSKMSGAMFVIVAAAMVLVRFVASAHPHRRDLVRPVLVSCSCVAALSLCAIWAAYGFHYGGSATGEPLFQDHWKPLSRFLPATLTSMLAVARSIHLLPEAYLYGFAYTGASAGLRPAFLDGSYSMTGFFDFFPRAFIYKTPIGTLILIVALIVAVTVAARTLHSPGSGAPTPLNKLAYRAAPLLLLLFIYGAFAVTAKLNIGHRHILPLYAVTYVLLGGCALYLRSRASIVVPLALAATVGESFAARPDYMAFFNPMVGGSSKGYQHLVDSSLDWGQDLPGLARWLDAHQRGAPPTYLGYFGTASPRYYGLTATELPAPNSGALHGGTYCISATTLQQVYSRAMGHWSANYEQTYGDLRQREHSLTRKELLLLHELELARLCATLRRRQPDAEIGHSILVFQLSDGEVERALRAMPPEVQVAEVL